MNKYEKEQVRKLCSDIEEATKSQRLKEIIRTFEDEMANVLYSK